MISGTSHDGIDIAVVDFQDEGAQIRARIEFTESYPYSEELDAQLAAILPPATTDLARVCELDTRIGQEFAHAAVQAITTHRSSTPSAGPIAAVCSHGQTVYHWVEHGTALGTLQVGQPAWITEATGLQTISDVRMADIAAGGQGAPLVPLLDAALLSPFIGRGVAAAALNLGGISNITLAVPGKPLSAWDIGPANALIDAVVAASAEVPGTYDRDGRLASTGSIIPALLDAFLSDPYYAKPAPKSSGKETFHLGYVHEMMTRAEVTAPVADIVATVTELTARTVADAVKSLGIDTLIAAGGGVRNPVIMRRLHELLPGVYLVDSGAFGIPADQKEAVAFALIGWATINGLPGNVPECTGAAGPRILGRITPALAPQTAQLVPSQRHDQSVENMPWSSAVVFAQ